MFQNTGGVVVERFFARLFEEYSSDHIMFAPKKNEDEEDEDIDDNFNDDEEEEEENPFDIEPTDKDILESDFPIDNPEDDLLDDDEEVPYN